MKFDYVDIGTCDFYTSADDLEINPSAKVLLVEPLKFYLDNIPSHDNIIKANFAIGDHLDRVSVYYLDQASITKFCLPQWLRGCSSIGRPHWLALDQLSKTGLSIELVKNYQIDMITFSDLCDRYDITGIERLKIDTEGHDHHILPGVYEKVVAGLSIDTIIFEYQAYMGNTGILDDLTIEFEKIGYTKSWLTNIDVKLDKIKDIK
jgi:hypothetical protein